MANDNVGNEQINDINLRRNRFEQQMREISLRKNIEDLKAKLHQAEQSLDLKNLRNNYLEDKLKFQRNRADSFENAAKHFSDECDIMQRKLLILQRETEHFSTAMERQNITIVNLKDTLKQVMIDKNFAIEENKAVCDEIRQLKSDLQKIIETRTDENLNSITLGRFQIKKKCIECIQCHQAFDSLAQMEASKCVFHPAMASTTGTAGRYYWKCCKTEAVGKSSPGCKEGRHVSRSNFNGNIT